MLSHLTKLAIGLVDDPTVTVEISNVSEGVSESSSFMYENEYDTITIEDSQNLQFAAGHTITAIGLKNDNISVADLRKFNDPDANAMVAAYGLGTGLISLEPVKVEFIDHFDTGDFWKFKITKKTLPYREPSGRRGAGLFVGRNLFKVYPMDASASYTNGDLPVGWELDATGVTSSFNKSSGKNIIRLELTGGAAGGYLKFEPIFWPFANDIITFSFEENFGGFGDWNVEFGFRAIDQAGSEFDHILINVVDFYERIQVYGAAEHTTPINYMIPVVKFTGGTTNEVVNVTDPNLMCGQVEAAEYTDY